MHNVSNLGNKSPELLLDLKKHYIGNSLPSSLKNTEPRRLKNHDPEKLTLFGCALFTPIEWVPVSCSFLTKHYQSQNTQVALSILKM
jgi:hypothetical protein